MKGKLIIIEGLDGSGKSTQIEILRQKAQQAGKQVRQVKFPNYAEDSSALVRAYLAGELGSLHEINAYAASVLYSVDRYATFRRHMKEDYDNGCIFLLDRYTTANMYHQTTKLPKEEWDSFLDWLEDLEYGKMGLPKPDLVLYLDMKPQTAKKLMENRYHGDESKKDLHEADFSYLLSCRDAALYAAQRCGWEVLSCCDGESPLPIDTISQMIWQKVEPLLG
ncbi:dTMP kinase [Negativibacillus massiliensis]|uniref:dTMP kinase n=1 Tax=Negativibacillus massiliensis TaxID=1871035 RepID=UPI00033BB926|nr:deoxynucleoside kinase [Negativibacillus massiliensis]CDA79248.1 thymidylate kinase [Clostridium sp. CAG:242]